MSEPEFAPDLSALLTRQEEFSAVVQLARQSLSSELPRVDLLYLRFLEEKPDIHALAEIIAYQIANYALPKKKLKALSSSPSSDISRHARLIAEAKAAFIKYNATDKSSPRANTRYSEVGELIAFCIASHFLNAGQVAAKMALKTNSEMPVFGLDGIHACADSDGTVWAYFLEAKVVSDAKEGSQQYAKSAQGFENDRKHKLNEQRIARDLSNLDLLEEKLKCEALKYFDPYTKEKGNVRERFVGIIAYNEELYQEKIPVRDDTPITIHQNSFLTNYETKHPLLSAELTAALTHQSVELGKCRAFFLALPDVAELKDLFAKALQGEHIR